MSNLGSVLETARRARGLTQAQLAEAVGTTQPSIQRYENNLREPDDETLAGLATALGVTPSFLAHSSRPEGAMAVTAHMRRRSTAPATIWRRLEAQLNVTRWHVAKLYESVSMRATLSVPRFDPDQYSPEECAMFVRTQWRMPLGPVRGLTSWLESSGILVIESDFGTSRVDGLSQWAEDHPVIVVNMNAPTDRKRLTLAHELGHIVMHADFAGEEIEDQANRFAAEFLMPADVIRTEFRNLTTGKLIDLKRAWGVSMAALIERAHHLGIITKQQRTSFYTMMSKRGWRTNEPASDELTSEVPQLTYMIGTQMFEAGLNRRDVASILGFAEPQDNYIIPTSERSLRAV
jgi:Zn-dependent peptidase ImmA (M78 family)/transcriptional regulator with XRE-family HTH domain